MIRACLRGIRPVKTDSGNGKRSEVLEEPEAGADVPNNRIRERGETVKGQRLMENAAAHLLSFRDFYFYLIVPISVNYS